MKNFPLVYIIIVNWNRRELLKQCLDSIELNTRYPKFRVVVVDNGSKDGSLEFVRRNHPWVDIIQNRSNLGFAKGNNQGIKLAYERGADYFFLLNNDTKVVDENWLLKMVELFESDPSIGIMGCKLVYPNGRLQHAGGIWSVKLNERDLRSPNMKKEVDHIIGAAFMIRRKLIEAIGLFDENFSPVYCEDSEYCLRAKMAGYKIIYNPNTTIIHDHGGTIQTLLSSLQMNYIGRKNGIRFMLLYFPRTWFLKRIKYEAKLFLGFIVEKKDPTRKLGPLNAKLREHPGLWLMIYFKAFWENLKVLDDIIRERQNRTRKIWY